MFTGIISATTPILKSRRAKDGLELIFKIPSEWTDVEVGESISTNGVCLTVTAIKNNEYHVFLVPETLAKTTFGKAIPTHVNLERALRATDRLSGHFVQGHIDTTAIISRIDSSQGYTLEVMYPEGFRALVTTKGSVAINGVALTIVANHNNTFSVALIPHTLKNTTLGELKEKDAVNVEFDMLGKYVIKFMELKANN